MIKLIIGKKGSGKTKKLVELVNSAAETSLGNVVCIEKGDVLTFSVTHKARLVDSCDFGISGYGEYFGFLAGIKAGNNDITHIFGDATLRIGGRDYEEFANLSSRFPATKAIFPQRFSRLPKKSDKNCYKRCRESTPFFLFDILSSPIYN